MDTQLNPTLHLSVDPELLERYRRNHAALAVLIESGYAHISELDVHLRACPDSECSTCAYLICPYREALHFHHDGCPSCDDPVPQRFDDGGSPWCSGRFYDDEASMLI